MAESRHVSHKSSSEQSGSSNLSETTSHNVVTTKSFQELREKFRQAGQAQEIRRRQQQPPAHFAFAIDGTESMKEFIADAKESIKEIIRRVQERAQQTVAIQFFIYRDYFDRSTGILEVSELSSDYQYLSEWLRRIVAQGGGDRPEAIEYALHRIFLQGGFRAVLLAGDAPSHNADEIKVQGWDKQISTAQELACLFRERDMPIHTFVVGQDLDTKQDFEAIAHAAGGVSGFLERYRDNMLDMAVMALLECLAGQSAVAAYMTEQRLLGPAQEFGKKLALLPARKRTR